TDPAEPPAARRSRDEPGSGVGVASTRIDLANVGHLRSGVSVVSSRDRKRDCRFKLRRVQWRRIGIDTGEAVAMLETFYEDLNKKPEDWSLRGVVADWYEDNGQLEGATAQRWMVQNHKRPYHGSSGTFTWFNLDSIDPGLGDPESDIPGGIYQHL